MLNISSKGLYSIAALFELALHYHKGPVQIKDISEAQDIPQNYLEQLLLRLKNHGFVKSFRGKNGGYALSKSPEAVNILKVLISLEGKLKILKNKSASNTLNHFWNGIQKDVQNVLNRSLDELINLKRSLEKNMMYHI